MKQQKASLATLFEEYRTLPEAVSTVIIADPESLKVYNKAVKRMHTLASRMQRDYDLKGAKLLADLLEVEEHQANLWAAQHLLEHFDVTEEIGEKALALLEAAAQGDTIEAQGWKAWLDRYYGPDGEIDD